MEKKVQIGDKEYTVKEIKYKDITSVGEIKQEDAAKRMMVLSVGLTDEEYDNLSMKDGLTLQKVVNELNGLEDFQKPLSE